MKNNNMVYVAIILLCLYLLYSDNNIGYDSEVWHPASF